MPDKIQELRDKLRAERTTTANISDDTGGSGSPTTSSTSNDIEQYVGDIINQDGHSIQPVSRPGAGAISVVRAIANTKRKSGNKSTGTSQSDIRSGSEHRRSSEDNGQSGRDGTDVQTSSSSGKQREVGNLVAYDEIPPAHFIPENTGTTSGGNSQTTQTPRKRGRPPKFSIVRNTEPQATIETKRSKFFSGGATLSKTEASELQESLIEALTDEFEIIDTMLWNYVDDPLKQPIWSDISEKEMLSLSKMILKLGQKSPTIATVARGAVDAKDYVTVATMLIPRVQTTVQKIRAVRKEKKQNAPKNLSRSERIRLLRERDKQADNSD